MTPKRPIHRVEVQNFLSLADVALDLQPLNVLAGPNGAGKTNFLKIFDFLGSIAERDLVPAVRQYGGMDWLVFQNSDVQQISINIKGSITSYSNDNALDEYALKFRTYSYLPDPKGVRDLSVISREEQFKVKRMEGPGRRITLSGRDLKIYDRSTNRRLDAESINQSTSGLALIRRLGEDYEAPQVEDIAQLFLSLRLLDIDVKQIRRPSAKRASTYLNSDASNVGAFLSRLSEEEPESFARVEEDMKAVLPSFEAFDLRSVGGEDESVAIFIKERQFQKPIPLARASFGTVRALALFAALHDPSPPRLTCVEEIDHGFHPQALDRIVERLREATDRTQIVLATHSPALVNRLKPEELFMFRRHEESGATLASQPDAKFVRKVKQKYGYELGELWFAGLLNEEEFV